MAPGDQVAPADPVDPADRAGPVAQAATNSRSHPAVRGLWRDTRLAAVTPFTACRAYR
jgi:hypothetical protein